MSVLEVTCSQPECHWHGPPSEAADHPCPTPAEAPLVADVPTDPIPETGADGGAPLFATKEELERWLVDNGSYTSTGEPADEATRNADRQYAEFMAAERQAKVEPEPAIADEPPAATNADLEVVPATDWQTKVAAQLRARPDLKQVRWALINVPTATLIDVYPVKTAAEEALIPHIDAGDDVTAHRISDLLKANPEPVSADGDQPTPEPEPEPSPQPDEPEPTVIDPITLEADQVNEELRDQIEDALAAETAAREAQTPDEGALAGDLDDDPDEDDTSDSPTTDKEAKPEAAAPALFDPADYDKPGLQIPKVDGHAIDRIALDFTGSVMLDRSEPAQVELYNRVGRMERSSMELWIEARWGGTSGKPATNRDGENDIIVGRKGLRVDSIRIVDPEQLGALEGLELVRAAARKAAAAGVAATAIEEAVVAALAETD